MSDPRINTVLDVLRESGVTTNLDDTDTLATKIVNALDREHGAPTEIETDDTATVGEHAGNIETPVGTATEGGSGNNDQ